MTTMSPLGTLAIPVPINQETHHVVIKTMKNHTHLKDVPAEDDPQMSWMPNMVTTLKIHPRGNLVVWYKFPKGPGGIIHEMDIIAEKIAALMINHQISQT